MNNIKTLARQYWDGLDTAQQKELFNANLSSGMESVYDTVCTIIENIFYSEVVEKWWRNSNKLQLMEKYPHQTTEDIYLKENYKPTLINSAEQLDEIMDKIFEQPKEVVICLNCKSFYWKGTEKCSVCDRQLFADTHPSNHKYIAQPVLPNIDVEEERERGIK